MAIDYQTLMMTDQMVPGGSNSADTYAGDKDAPSLYWRLADDGRIQLLKGGPNGLERAMRGDVPLAAYGMVKRAQRMVQSGTDEFIFLVQRGGAHELTAAQTLGLRWHRRPNPNRDTLSHRLIWQRIDQLVMQGVNERDALIQVLPQLKGVDISDDIECQYCNGRVFLTAEHRNKHESVMHREDVRTRELRDSITDALKTQASNSKNGGIGGLATVIDLLAQNLAALAAQGSETRALVEEALQTKLAAADEPDEDDDEPVARRRGRPPKTRDGVE